MCDSPLRITWQFSVPTKRTHSTHFRFPAGQDCYCLSPFTMVKSLPEIHLWLLLFPRTHNYHRSPAEMYSLLILIQVIASIMPFKSRSPFTEDSKAWDLSQCLSGKLQCISVSFRFGRLKTVFFCPRHKSSFLTTIPKPGNWAGPFAAMVLCLAHGKVVNHIFVCKQKMPISIFTLPLLPTPALVHHSHYYL